MNLHEDRDQFEALILLASKKLGILDLHIEKDYWVTLALKNLSKSEFANQVVFKGGTSLSKAHKIIQRFSEDIDLAVIVDSNATGGQIKKQLQLIEAACVVGFTEVTADARISKHGRFRKTVWNFPKISAGGNYGDAGEYILIEVNSFTDPEPHADMQVESLIAQYLREDGKEEVVAEFNLQPFLVSVLRAERTFVEKISAIVKGCYTSKVDTYEVLAKNIRHFYDLAKLIDSCGQRVLENKDQMQELLGRVKKDDGKMDTKGEWAAKKYKEAPVFIDFDQVWGKIKASYTGSFANMIYAKEKLPDEAKIKTTIEQIAAALNKFEE